MSQNGTKHVQIELDEEEYEAFRAFARERGLTVTEAGYEALVSWVERQRRADPADRAFTALDELADASLSAAAETDAHQETDPVEEWSGDDVEFTLVDDPPAER